jgi:hypothetical protein
MRDETRFIPTSREFALFALFHTFIVLGQDSFVKELRSLSPLHDTRVINDLSVLGASFWREAEQVSMTISTTPMGD